MDSEFSVLPSTISNATVCRAKQRLGLCCQLQRCVRRVLTMLLTLYSMPRCDEDDETGQQRQLVQLLRVNMGQIKYASNVCSIREKDIFTTRQDLVRLDKSCV